MPVAPSYVVPLGNQYPLCFQLSLSWRARRCLRSKCC
jgi:hypothetical protein